VTGDPEKKPTREVEFGADLGFKGGLDMGHTRARNETSRRWVWATAIVTLLAVWLSVLLPWAVSIVLGVVAAMVTYWTGSRAVQKVIERFRQQA
jgi:uncharacterized protein (DUF2062 family)